MRQRNRTGRWRGLLTGGLAAVLAAGLLVGLGANQQFVRAEAADTKQPPRPPACTAMTPPDDQPSEPSPTGEPSGEPSPGPQPPPQEPTTVSTIGQAYYCILDNYFSGPVLDPRSLLVPAFTALTQELQRRGLDQPDATLPALTGDRDQDWQAFRLVYQRISAALPDDDARQAVSEATLEAMVASLNDNHAVWQHGFNPNTTGLMLSVSRGPGIDPVATAPMYVTEVGADSPASRAGVKPGDEIVAVNDVPPYVNGVLSEGVVDWLLASPEGSTLKLTLHRPATDATVTVTMTAKPSRPPLQNPTEGKLVSDDLAYVTMRGFGPGFADQVFAEIAKLREQATLRGIILDLRGNRGGSPQEVARLLGGFAHDEITSYWCDVKERCTPNRTDDSVSLVNLPLVVLTDRNCASACDSFASAVKDLELGTLVGTRTAGAVSGPGEGYLLENNTALMLPKHHEVGVNKQIVNEIGVAPDHQAPLTPADLSAGRDPGVAKAMGLLH